MSAYTIFDIDNLFERRFFSDLDYFFAQTMARVFNETDAVVQATCALVSRSLTDGHVCLDIDTMAGQTWPLSEAGNECFKLPDHDSWIRALHKSSMVSEAVTTPLVMDGDNRLYLSRYYDFQVRLSQNIANRVLFPASDVDESAIDLLMEVYFPGTSPPIMIQKRAVKSAILNHFTIISGGPGTGKTFVTKCIKKLLSGLAEKFKQSQPRILCVAPTGKAASKMDQGRTIHSVLKPLTSGTGFFHNKKNLLCVDVIIIDEASMIDLLLLTRLLEAVPLTARVILLGDNHQLTSIQAGSVFYDICSVNGLSKHQFFLEYNFRSKGKTGIEALSRAINSNDADNLESLLTQGGFPDIVFENLEVQDSLTPVLKKIILKEYTPFVRADSLEASLNELESFKILCAHNSGEYGTLQINHVCENILRSEHNFDIQGRFFKRIIMVKTNDYKRKLFNGDTGIVFEKREGANAFFISQGKVIKHYRESDLPGFDTAFAITIHKSQGSEYKTVLIVIPDKLSPVVTRQLLYTGVTRAGSKVIILGRMGIIKKAIQVCVKRNSGIGPCLEAKLLTKSLE